MEVLKKKILKIYHILSGKASIFFWLGFAIELFIMITGFSIFEIPFRGRLTHLAFFLFGIKIMLSNYKKTEWIIIIFLGIIATISYLNIGDEWVLRIVVMILASKGISFHQMIKWIFFISLIGLLSVVLLSVLGIAGDMNLTADFGRGGIETRWCLGFSHPNNLHGTVWYVLAAGLLYRKGIKLFQAIILTIINLVLYSFTVSRTGFLVAEIMIVGALIYLYFPKIKKIRLFYHMGGLGSLFLVAISIYSAAFGVKHNLWLYKLSQLLTDRLESLIWWEDFNSWTLFGAEFEKEPVDIGFITIVSNYGYVILGIYLIAILLLIYDELKKEKFIEFLVLMTCVFYTFMESSFVINVPLLCNFTFVLLLGNWDHLFEQNQNYSKGMN